MILAGADRICFVISPEKTDIIPYYARHREARRFCYVVQEHPVGLCDALFRAVPLVRDDALGDLALEHQGQRAPPWRPSLLRKPSREQRGANIVREV